MISRRLSKCKPEFAVQSPALLGFSGQLVSYLTKEETGKKGLAQISQEQQWKAIPQHKVCS